MNVERRRGIAYRFTSNIEPKTHSEFIETYEQK